MNDSASKEVIDVKSIAIFLLALLAFVGWFLFINLRIRESERSASVSVWTTTAYDEGRNCEKWKFAEDVCEANRKFLVDALIAAHKGAFD